MTVDEEINAFCENIVVLRKRSNLNVEDMARIMKISAESLECVEKGIFPDNVPFDVVFRIERHFGIKANMLFQKPIS